MIKTINNFSKWLIMTLLFTTGSLANIPDGYRISDIESVVPLAAENSTGSTEVVVGNILLTLTSEGIIAVNLDTGYACPLEGADLAVRAISAEGRRLFLKTTDDDFYTAVLLTPEAMQFSVDVGSEGGFSFSPANLTISAGDSVDWEWKSGTHSTTSGTNCIANGIWDSGIRSSGSFTRTFTTAGNFPYFCIPHCGMGMVGSITVTGGPQVLTATAFATPVSGAAPLAVAFTGSAAGGAAPYIYSWDFGDGTAFDTSAATAHTYVSEGSFTASFTVTDSLLASAAYNIVITVGTSPPSPPVISSVAKTGSPFRLFINGDNFHSDAAVYIGSDQQPWQNIKFKSGSRLVLKKGADLKNRFPAGIPVTITVVNGDGGTATITYTRP